MEIETLFTEQRWYILKSLSNSSLSPLQLAESSNTTIANISQQLRLLEASDLVKKEKIRNRDKGKPRALFSLTDDYAYLITTMNRFAKKRLLALNDFNKVILRILFLKNQDLHYYIIKLYLKIEEFLPQLDTIAVNYSEDNIKLILVGDKSKEIKKKLNITSIKGNTTKKVEISAYSYLEFSKLNEDYEIIYNHKSEGGNV